MRNSLLEELEANGYAVIEDFLKPDEIEQLLEAEGAIDEKGELKLDPLNALNKVGHALHTDIPVFQNITCCDRVREICWQLGYKRPAVPQSMYIYKNAGIGGEVIPHQDASYLFTEPNSTLGFWIALQDATQQNGCLQFIKGSHKSGVHRRYIRNPDTKSEELLVYDRAAPIYPQSSFTPLPVNAGTLVLIHGNVVHKSDLNRSNKSRHAYTFHIVETQNTKWSEENWLQPPKDKEFPIFYEAE
ncbi:unnamed protein product [Hermetia illucens]|uniref:Phytanoyl-CoA dioxygenase n=1 Tax=Hermetia illucens TaxID=343691 RepID=A0A7R8UPS7_HERIL|nr:unnamed protein product [Hermetia illucens]